MTNNSDIRPDYKKFERSVFADILYLCAYFLFFCVVALAYNFYIAQLFWMPDWLTALVATLHVDFDLDGFILLSVIAMPLLLVGICFLFIGYTFHPHEPKHHLTAEEIEHHSPIEIKVLREQYPELFDEDGRLREQTIKKLDKNTDIFSSHHLLRIATYMTVTVIMVAILEFVFIELLR